MTYNSLCPKDELKPSNADSRGLADPIWSATSDMRKTLCEGVFLGLFEYMNLFHHHFGIDCKLSGSVFSVSDIVGAVPLIHGPSGCAFHHRFTPWRMYAPVYNVESTNLGENDVIYGGERKLEEGIVQAYRKYHPSLIVVLPTCVSGLIGDDISGICHDLRSEINCDIVHVSSEGFSHRGRELDDGLHAMANSWTTYQSSASEEYELKGCGQEEVAKALVDQLMEEQDVKDNQVNIELNGRCRFSFKRRLEEMKRIFKEIGIGINATLLGGTVEDIKRASAACLNVVTHNRIAAKRMNERFGTGIFKKEPTHNGINGTEQFYIDVASKFGLAGEAEAAMKREKEQAIENLIKLKRFFGNYRFAMISHDWMFNPHMVRALVDDLGINLKYFCVNTHQLRRMYVPSGDDLKSLQAELEQLFSCWGLDSQIIINPNLKEIMNVAKNVDCMLSSEPAAIWHGCEITSTVVDVSSMNYLLFQTSFKGFVEFAHLLALNIKNVTIPKENHSIISRFNYDQIYYPLINDKSCSASREMWDLWKS